MNYKAINKYFIDLLFEGKRVSYGEYNNKIAITDSYILYLIDKENIYIDLQKCIFIPNIKNVIPDEYDYNFAYLTDTIQLTNKDKYRFIINKDLNVNCQVNEKYLKYVKNVNYKVKSDNKPVLFYINDELSGLICTVIEL